MFRSFCDRCRCPRELPTERAGHSARDHGICTAVSHCPAKPAQHRFSLCPWTKAQQAHYIMFSLARGTLLPKSHALSLVSKSKPIGKRVIGMF